MKTYVVTMTFNLQCETIAASPNKGFAEKAALEYIKTRKTFFDSPYNKLEEKLPSSFDSLIPKYKCSIVSRWQGSTKAYLVDVEEWVYTD